MTPEVLRDIQTAALLGIIVKDGARRMAQLDDMRVWWMEILASQVFQRGDVCQMGPFAIEHARPIP